MKKLSPKILAFFCVLTVFSCIFYIFSYNSGYGYDALEYANIARSMTDGYPFFSFIPAKSWAFYYLIWLFLFLGVGGHAGIAGLVTLIFSGIFIATFFVIKEKFNFRIAFLSSLLVGISTFFMELNFLEPEGLVYLFGLFGFYHISNAFEKLRRRDLVLGGFWIGVGMSFKVVAGFYLVGVIIFIFFWDYFKEHARIANIMKKELYVLAGFMAALFLPMIYFLLTGRLAEYLKWTYFFPLFKYPSLPFWFSKLYTKVLWFWLLLIAAFVISIRKSLRKSVYTSPDSWLIISMGAFSLIPLLKSQASHFLFPGAAFLSVFIATIADRWVYAKRGEVKWNRLYLGAAAAVLLLGTSVYLYRPNAIYRLFRMRDYRSEPMLKSTLQGVVPEGKKVLFFRDSVFLYWISERYPNLPFFNLDVQASYWIGENKDRFLGALEDPDLMLVEFNPDSPGLYNRRFMHKRQNRDLMEEFYKVLRKNFVLHKTDIPHYVFWTRKGIK